MLTSIVKITTSIVTTVNNIISRLLDHLDSLRKRHAYQLNNGMGCKTIFSIFSRTNEHHLDWLHLRILSQLNIGLHFVVFGFLPVIELMGQINKDVSCDEYCNESFRE